MHLLESIRVLESIRKKEEQKDVKMHFLQADNYICIYNFICNYNDVRPTVVCPRIKIDDISTRYIDIY